MKKLLLAFLFCLFAQVALAQNVTCATRPPGDNSNACASTAYVQSNPGPGGVVAGNVFFKSGKPWCDVVAMGAVGDSVTNDFTAIQACVDLVSAFGSGGTVYFPPTSNTYCAWPASGTIGISHNSGTSIIIRGAARNVVLDSCHHDITTLYLNVGYDKVIDMSVFGKGVNNDTVSFGANHPAIQLDANCVNCVLTDMTVFGGSNVISINTSDTIITDVNASLGYASQGAIIYVGSPSLASGNWFIRDKLDQQWPVGYPTSLGTIPAWQANHAYTAGVNTVVSTQGYLIQCITSGTSSNATGPTLKNYGILINDGTAQWYLVAPQKYYSLNLDTHASENQAFMMDHTGPFSSGIALTNSLATVAPAHFVETSSVVGQTTESGILLNDGTNVFFTNMRVGGPLLTGGAGLVTQSLWVDRVSIIGSEFDSGSYGILLGVGTNNIVNGNFVYGTTIAGIEIGATTDNTRVTNNDAGASTSAGGNVVGIVSLAGATHCMVLGNTTFGAGTGFTNSATCATSGNQ